jgi:sulfate adenylyltransferase subunit 1 (EFTu-like GTPase family)
VREVPVEQETLNFVIVGHVDHGKSTLIGRLLYDTRSLPRERVEEMDRISRELGREREFAFLMDHLEEERAGGLTIDTAQTFFRREGREYVIIDAPGHKEFIKNMVTGAAQADAALLIVDVAEGVREQTRRHAYLLQLLGLSQLAVVVNKMDLVGYGEGRFRELVARMGEVLRAVGLSPVHSIPVSAREGENVAARSTRMPWYAGPTVLEVLGGFRAPPRAADKPVRLAIQDVYEVGAKRILVGRVEAGAVRVGERVAFLPGGGESTVVSIEKFLAPGVLTAGVGESIGITIADPLPVARGQIACAVGAPTRVTEEVQAKVFWMSSAPLGAGEELVLRLATQEVSARVAEMARRVDAATLAVVGEGGAEADARSVAAETDLPAAEAGEAARGAPSAGLANGEVAEVTIRTGRPIACEPFRELAELGRFVLARDGDIVAGGIITR